MSEQWQDMALGNCYDLISERADAPALPRESPYFGLEHLDPASPLAVAGGFVTDVTGQVNAFEASDTLFGRLRAYLRKVSFAVTGGYCSPEILVLRPRTQVVVPRFLQLLACSEDVIQQAVASSAGSRMPRTSARDLASIPVLIPPLSVQRRIVDLMEHLDTLVECLQAEQSALDDVWWAMTRSLQSECFGLSRVALGDVAEISGGITKNKSARLMGDAVEVPYLRVANVHRRFLDLTDVATIRTTGEVLERLRLLPGDVLMNEGGDKDKLGRGAVWQGEIENCIHQNHVFRVRVATDFFLPEFVSAWANSFGQEWFLEHGKQTTGIASISKTTLSQFPLPRLTLERQRDWAEALGGIFGQMQVLEREETSLRQLRDSVLRGLLDGAIGVDESYDDLLGVAS